MVRSTTMRDQCFNKRCHKMLLRSSTRPLIFVFIVFVGLAALFHMKFLVNFIEMENRFQLKEELEAIETVNNGSNASVIAVLVLVCDRPTIYRSLDLIFKYRPSKQQFPVIVSQDCGNHSETTKVLKRYRSRITHIHQPDLREINLPSRENVGYFKIARHYGWALNYTFNVLNYETVIVVEDDLEIAPDFFEYFTATLPIMRKDPTIWCVSAWNDNGKAERINQTAYDMLYRTDFFPGLGWMLTKTLWAELMGKWPIGYWDDWIREHAQRLDRVCIRPEISRTSTFGKQGVSRGTYFDQHLRFIKLNDQFFPFQSQDLSYLIKANYDEILHQRVKASKIANSLHGLLWETVKDKTNTAYRLTYNSQKTLSFFAKHLGIMNDFWDGIARMSYYGIISVMINGHRCYLIAEKYSTFLYNVTHGMTQTSTNSSNK